MKNLAFSAGADDWPKVYNIVNTLLDYGVTVLWCTEEVIVAGKRLPPGSFLIPVRGILADHVHNDSLQAVSPLSESEIEEFLRLEGINPFKGESSEPVNVLPLNPTRVGVYADAVYPYNFASVAATSGFEVEFVSGKDIAAGALERFHILMVSGGGRNRENSLLAPLGEEGAKRISEFVKKGGAYLGSCGGAYMATVIRERFQRWWNPAQRHVTLMNVEDWHISEFSDSGFRSPGMGTVTVRNVAADNPVMFGMPELFKCTHYNGPIFNLIEGAVEQASSATPLVAFDEVSSDAFTPSEFFYESENPNLGRLRETGIYRACKEKRCGIAQGQYGLGIVVLSGLHPEHGEGIQMDKWRESARMVSNLALWSGAQSKGRADVALGRVTTPLRIPVAPQKRFLTPLVQGTEKVVEALRTKTPDSLQVWLEQRTAARSFGLTLEDMWRGALERLPFLCKELISRFETMDEVTEEVLRTREEITRELQNGKIDERVKRVLNHLRARALDLLLYYHGALAYRRSPLWRQDGGYDGVQSLLESAYSRCRAALENLTPTARSRASSDNNPYLNMCSPFKGAMAMLSAALHLLQIHQSAMEKFLRLWRLFRRNLEPVSLPPLSIRNSSVGPDSKHNAYLASKSRRKLVKRP